MIKQQHTALVAPQGCSSVDALTIEHVSHRYHRSGAALDDVSLRVPHGRLVAIMGRSGSGKSTLLQCSAGLLLPTSGSIRVGMTDVTVLSESERTRLRRTRIGFVFQSFNLVPALTALENTTLPLLLSGQSAPQRGMAALEAVGLAGRAGDTPGRLSGGQQQRVAIARAMVTAPDIIFADEPTAALDPVTSDEVMSSLRTAVDEQHRTTVLVTHDPVAAQWADEVILLHAGRIVHSLAQPAAADIQLTLRNLGGLP